MNEIIATVSHIKQKYIKRTPYKSLKGSSPGPLTTAKDSDGNYISSKFPR